MNSRIILAAALACAFAASAASTVEPEAKPGATPSDPEPRNPAPFDAPSQTIPLPAAGHPQPPAVPPSEGLGRPGADEALVRAVKDALREESGAPPVRTLGVAAVDGKVALTGSVRTQKDKDAVTAKAGEVAGLRNVTNALTIRP